MVGIMQTINIPNGKDPSAGRQSDDAWYTYYNIIRQVNTILKNIDGARASN